jgi:hypothetical protein
MNLALYHGQNASAWHLHTSDDIRLRAEAGAIPILPVASFCRRGDDEPLDAEESLLGTLLLNLQGKDYLILPPLRYCPLQDPRQLFTTSSVTAWSLLSETLHSIHTSGFQKCILFHGHPLLADWLDCGLRDHRLKTGMGLYRMSLESTGVDIEDASTRASFTNEHPLYETAFRTLSHLLEQIAKQPLPPALKA